MPKKQTPQVRPGASKSRSAGTTTSVISPAAPPAEPNGLITAAAVRADIDECLQRELKDFAAEASPEEKRIMLDILNNRDNSNASFRDRGRQYEVGLLTGFQQLTTDEHVLIVPDGLVYKAENAVRDLARQRDMETARKPYSADDVRAKWQAELQASFDLFIGKATVEETRFLTRVLYGWEEYLDDEESKRPAVPIVEAARYQLGCAEEETDQTLATTMGNFFPELMGHATALIESASTLKDHIAKVKRSAV